MVEMLDIYDDNLNPLGSKPRPAVHRDGDWHRVFHCWVIYRDAEGADWVIAQKRSATKLTFPNFLDVSAAGHYAAGETAREGVRELQEELGLTVQFEDLIPVGRRLSAAQYAGLIDREVADVYFCVCDQSLHSYNYQRDELAGLVAVNVDEGLRLFTGEAEQINVPAVGLGNDTISIRVSDFVPTRDFYFEKALLLARRCLNGETHLYI